MVSWELHPMFRDAAPHVFQLQMGRTANPDADDWTNVGGPITDDFYAIDDTQRVYGKTQWTHYRVRMITEVGTYYSKPELAAGALTFREWRLAKAIIRAESLRLRKTPAGDEGYVLKRKLYGTPCPCRDRQTQETREPQHTTCYGTGFVGGYFTPIPCCYAELSNLSKREMLDTQSRGSVNDMTVVNARMLAIPQLDEEDVWVSKKNDTRWYVHAIQHLEEMRNVPLIYTVQLSLAPFTDVVYKFPIPDQVQ